MPSSDLYNTMPWLILQQLLNSICELYRHLSASAFMCGPNCFLHSQMDARKAQFPYPWQQNCKILHLVRHGLAMHNVEGDKNPKALLSPSLFDAQLSPTGLQQVDQLRNDFVASGTLNRIELVITSPLSRAMQTAVGVFGSEGQAISTPNSPKIMAVELCRDRLGVRPCDKRRKISNCQNLFPSIDFSMMDDEDDNLWNPDNRETEEELVNREAEFFKWLWTRPEKEIAVVSHGLILQNILINLLGNDCNPSLRAALLKRFEHGELRSVVIVDEKLVLCRLAQNTYSILAGTMEACDSRIAAMAG